MAIPAVLAVLEQAQTEGFRRLVVTGGEPLIHPDRAALLLGLREAQERQRRDASGPAQRRSTCLVLRSNFALPLTDDELAAIAGVFDQVVVSIDGTRETHDERRGPGSYDAAGCPAP